MPDKDITNVRQVLLHVIDECFDDIELIAMIVAKTRELKFSREMLATTLKGT